MIKKFIDRLLGKSAKPAIPKGKRVEVPLSEHNIDLKLVDDNAIRVVKTLADAGYEAYIVGGAVRDLLLGLRPKDFDVATNATPEQVKGLFRRAFIIGRRFRIVHVVFGRGREHEVIEVSTFRAMLDASASEQVAGNEKTSKAELADKHHAVDASGRVLRDNVWGPQIEDAARRDFTVNAMYYDPQRQIVVDYHGGIKDAKKKVLRMIGDPVTRYREDPVRIVRVVRFAAKLGFSIDPKTRAPIRELAGLLDDVPASRTFDEMIKLLQTGHALASIEELRKQGLVGERTGVFPILDVVLADANKHPERQKFVELALSDTDRRVNEGKPVAPSFMLACMLWHDVLDRWEKLKKKGEAPFPALQQSVDAVFDARIGDISGRGKLAADMREIWLMQPRFERRTGNGPFSLVEQPRFRAGFDFLRLRADAGEADPELARWWEEFSLADEDKRTRLMDQLRGQGHGGPRRRAPSAAAPAAPTAAEAEGDSEPVEGSADAPRKRRRRRRKPAGASGDAAPSSNG
ncbi:polynucleotide adenylyltransferase PcnB [Rhizobacter sp. J219]|uniref:polynucleotide adenylyltransferase PcnB n=1 Tax=Rhizobacter sp. J219 TaxID=2898430 RepID=UPI0021507960|nr:polynucleotide adenylyltransferase PcnB [Rhizobacter sp. J219]MCR5881390.1 polynucleotide adenylyltransferase PcnB [Rhizobacter sp. J219]